VSGAVAALVAASDRRIARQLREAGATAPERAVSFEPERGIDRRRLGRLEDKGVVHRANGGYWLDEPAWEAMHARRRTQVLIVLAIAILAFAAITYFSQSH